jgi:hypothetical protein
MRNPLSPLPVGAFLAASALAASASGQAPLGKRTEPPAQAMAGIGQGLSDAELDAEIAAAAAFPLGSLKNPIRVGGPDGARVYLGRLRCADGTLPRVGASRPAGIGAYGTLVDAYPVDCGAVAPGRAELVFDLYQEDRPETRAPTGFTLDSH